MKQNFPNRQVHVYLASKTEWRTDDSYMFIRHVYLNEMHNFTNSFIRFFLLWHRDRRLFYDRPADDSIV